MIITSNLFLCCLKVMSLLLSEYVYKMSFICYVQHVCSVVPHSWLMWESSQLSLTAGSCEEAVSYPSQLAHVRKQSVIPHSWLMWGSSLLSLTAGSCEEAVCCPSQLAHVRKQSVVPHSWLMWGSSQLSLTAGSCEEAVSYPSQLAHVRKQSVVPHSWLMWGSSQLLSELGGWYWLSQERRLVDWPQSNNLFNLISAKIQHSIK